MEAPYSAIIEPYDSNERTALWRLEANQAHALLLERFREGGPAIMDVFERTPDRRRRLAAVLDLGVQDQKFLTAFVWALDELTADPDPRRWDPDDVALLLWHARRCLERRPGAPLCVDGPPDPRVTHQTRSEESFRSIFSQSLVPMGLMRAIELMNDRDEADLALSNLMPLPDHFPYEGRLCLEEPGRQCVKNWMDIDKKAPTPDLDRVRVSLRLLDTNGEPR